MGGGVLFPEAVFVTIARPLAANELGYNHHDILCSYSALAILHFSQQHKTQQNRSNIYSE